MRGQEPFISRVASPTARGVSSLRAWAGRLCYALLTDFHDSRAAGPVAAAVLARQRGDPWPGLSSAPPGPQLLLSLRLQGLGVTGSVAVQGALYSSLDPETVGLQRARCPAARAFSSHAARSLFSPSQSWLGVSALLSKPPCLAKSCPCPLA